MNTNKELMYISRSSIPSSKFKKNKNNIFLNKSAFMVLIEMI